MKAPNSSNHEMNRELLWRNYPTDTREISLRNFSSIEKEKPLLNVDGSIIDVRTGDNPYFSTPIFSARVDDMLFIGFNLSAADAKGKVYNESNWVEALANPRWYFVVEERAGEPMFGADKYTGLQNRQLKNWDELEWGDLISSNDFSFINANKLISIETNSASANSEEKSVIFGSNSGDVAMALNQRSTRVFLHGYDMLINL